jgi:nucleoside-diphosphate-sugar epimerase
LPATGISPAAEDDPARRKPDISRMRERYGWAPRVALADGLAETVAYFQNEIEERSASLTEAA